MMLDVLQIMGIVGVALCGVLVFLFVRRLLISWGGGTIEMSVRLSQRYDGRGWAPGLARFKGDDLRWYRMFSAAFRPRRVLSRRDLEVQSRRAPRDIELLALPSGSVILRCMTGEGVIEIALNESALTGFLSWLEAAPPGAASRRISA